MKANFIKKEKSSQVFSQWLWLISSHAARLHTNVLNQSSAMGKALLQCS